MPEKSAKSMTDDELAAESEKIGSRFRECLGNLQWMWDRILEVEAERSTRKPEHRITQ